MDMLIVQGLLIYLGLGLLTGFVAGLLGVGGGGILVPLLASAFSIQGMTPSVHLALGTALMCMVVTSIASARAHHVQQNVLWGAALRMAVGIVIASAITTQLASRADSVIVATFFAGFMAVVALQMFVGWQPRNSKSPMRMPGLFTVGLVIGSASALAAVGGAFFSIVYLTYKNVDIRKAIGTSSAIGLPIAGVGALGYIIGGWSYTTSLPWTTGFIYWPAFVLIATASALAAPMGAKISHKLPSKLLKRALAVLSLMLSIRMLMTVL